jgi:hypothetical protein
MFAFGRPFLLEFSSGAYTACRNFFKEQKWTKWRAKNISPIIFAAAHYDDLKVVYHSTERQFPRDDHDTGSVFSRR